MRLDTKPSYNAQILSLVRKYVAAGGPEPVCPRVVAKWAIDNGEWDRHKFTAVSQCAKEISKALREDYYLDTQGRTVRANHSIRIVTEQPDGKHEQQTFWHDHRRMPRDFAERSFQQRRTQIVGDCKQLKTDVDSYNDNHSADKPIQLVLDFTYDIAEDELANAWRRPRQK